MGIPRTNLKSLSFILHTQTPKHRKASNFSLGLPPELISQIPPFNAMTPLPMDPRILQVLIPPNQQLKNPLYFIQLFGLPLLPLHRLQLARVITEIRIHPVSQMQHPTTSDFLGGVYKVVLDSVCHATAVQKLDIGAKILFQFEHLVKVEFRRFHVVQEPEPAEFGGAEHYCTSVAVCLDELRDVAGESRNLGDGGQNVVFALKGFNVIRGILRCQRSVRMPFRLGPAEQTL